MLLLNKLMTHHGCLSKTILQDNSETKKLSSLCPLCPCDFHFHFVSSWDLGLHQEQAEGAAETSGPARSRGLDPSEYNIEWRRSFRALLRAAKGIQNKTIANKVVRNIKLTYHLVPKQQHETWVDQREGNQASPSGEDYERKDRRYKAALRFINHLATISKVRLQPPLRATRRKIRNANARSEPHESRINLPQSLNTNAIGGLRGHLPRDTRQGQER